MAKNIKKAPDKFKNVFLEALSYFPELDNTFVFLYEMPFFGVQHTSRSYPPLVILHWPKRKWVFPIVINKNKNINLPFENLNFEQQVGILSHELSHLAAYVNFSRRKILAFSIKYLFSKKFVRKIEQETDLRAIKNGAGIYLLDERIFSFEYRMNNPYPEVEDTYMSPREIIECLKRYPSLYDKGKIESYDIKLKNIKNNNLLVVPSCITFSRKVKHILKTIIGFIPGFMGMFYIITIKKIHLKD